MERARIAHVATRAPRDIPTSRGRRGDVAGRRGMLWGRRGDVAGRRGGRYGGRRGGRRPP
eukprot:7535443-Lingulodinium_polyedra.AAC.1